MNATDIILNIRKIVRSINLENKKVEKETGVSLPQLLCLRYVQAQENFQASSTELKRYLNLNASTITGIIDRLVKKGYLARLPKMKDKRVAYVALTASGERFLKTSPMPLQDQLNRKLEKMPPEKVLELQKALEMIVSLMGLEAFEAEILKDNSLEKDLLDF